MSSGAGAATPFVWLVRLYQKLLSPLLPATCRYYPSCSSYAVTAMQRLGLLRGGYLAARRLLRCHPWSVGGIDHVPATWDERDSEELSRPRLGEDSPTLSESDLDDLRRRIGAVDQHVTRQRRTAL